MSRSVLTATVLLASAALTGCSSWAEPAATPPPTFKVTGAVVLSVDVSNHLVDDAGNPVQPIDGSCKSEGLHADIADGAQVLIRDGNGKLAGVGQLSAGVAATEGTCSFALTVSEVTNGLPFYSVEVAHRGQTYYTAANIQKPLTVNLG